MKRVVLGGVALGALLVVGVAVVTQTPLLKALVLPRLGDSLGVEARAGSLVVDADGTVLVRDLRLRHRELGGPAGELLSAERVRARVSWGALLRGDVVLRDLHLERPRGRVSVAQQDGALNVAPLFESAGEEGGAEFPAVRLRGAALEFGEHAGGRFTLLKSIEFDGELRRAGEGFDVALVEREDSASSSPLAVRGEVDAERVRLELQRVALADFPPETMPTSIREGFALLDLRGAVSGATLRYAPEEGVAVEVDLADVGINLPFDREGNLARTGDVPRMSRVTGTLELSRGGFSAELSGLLEDLPYHVTLDYRGTAMDAPFRATLRTEDFVLLEEPRLLPYIPQEIERALRAFSSPTATIDAEVTLSRGLAPWSAADRVVVEGGFVRFEHGVASLDQFPYPFHEIEGLIRFDGDVAEIRQVSGVAASGARLLLSGEIAPLHNRPAIHLEMELQDLPIDAALRAAAPEERRWLIEELFSEWRLNQLVREGLVRVEGDGGEGGGAEGGAPLFAMGGAVDVRAVVDLAGAGETPWVEATVSSERLAVLPQKFAVPVIAEGVVVRANPVRVWLAGGSYRTIEGDAVSVAGHLELAGRREGEELVPTVRMGAEGVRPTPLVLNAVAQAGEPDEPRESIESMLRGLEASGAFDAQVRIGARPDGSPGFDAEVSFAGARLSPAGLEGWPALEIGGVAGVVRANERVVEVEASADEPAPLSVRAEVVDAPAGESRPFDVAVRGEGVDLRTPFASLVGVFSEEGAAEVARIATAHEPAGESDLGVRVWRAAGEDGASVEVAFEGAQDAGFTYGPGRVGVSEMAGRVRYRPGAGAEFEGVEADVSVDGRSAGRVTLDGAWPGEAGGGAARPLVVGLRRTPVDHPLARWMAGLRLGEESANELGEVFAGGRFDLDAVVTHLEGDEREVTGVLTPDRLRLRRGGRELVLRGIEGGVDIGPGGVVAEELRGRLGAWEVTLRGVVEPLVDGGYAITGSLEASGPELDDDGRALLPRAVADVAEAVSLGAAGPVVVRVPDLSMELSADGEVRSVAAAGVAELSRAVAEVGVLLEDVEGRLRFRYEHDEGGAAPEFLVEVEAPSLRAGGLRLADARAEIASVGERGRVWVRTFEARTHDGRLVGRAMLDGPAGPAGEEAAPWRYAATVRMSDVRLAPALEDLRAREGGEVWVEPEGGVPRRDSSRGVLSGEVSLGGVVGDRASRRGRGSAQVGQGRVLDLPLLMPLVEVANLQLPSSAPVDLAMAEFFVEGDRVTFEELSAFGGGVEIYGFGTLGLEGRELDLRFATRAVRPIPVVGQIVEGLQNELVGLRVGGTVSRPDVSAETLRGTRAVLGQLFGGSESAEEREMSRIERELGKRRERVRRASERMRRLAASVPEAPAGGED